MNTFGFGAAAQVAKTANRSSVVMMATATAAEA